MAMSSFDKDMNIIQQLSDEPNDRDGLTAGELKAKFDEGGLAVKNYLNNTVRPFVNTLDTNTSAHAANANNPHSVTKSQVGLGNVPNVSTNDQTPTYSAAGSLTALSSGEKLSVAFGKLKKAVADLISHLANTSNPHSVTYTQTGAAAASHTHGAGDITSGTLPLARGGTGETTAKAAASALIVALGSATANVADTTLVATSDQSGETNTWYKRPATSFWNYIKGKADAVYSAIGHNHDSRYYILTTGTAISSNADLNDATYRTPGNYYCNQNATAKTVKHTPNYDTTTLVNTNMAAFTLKVSYSAGASDYISQELRIYSNGRLYYRYYANSTWSDWVLVRGPISPLLVSLKSSSYDVMDTTLICTSAQAGEGSDKTWFKRPATAIWNYIKGKADSVYAAISHSHAAGDITSGTLAVTRGGTGNSTGYVTAGKKSGTTLGSKATAEGSNTTASGDQSHAEGLGTVASGNYSHAEGQGTTASGTYAHAEGSNTTASGTWSHAEGIGTTASGLYAHAEGATTIASGEISHAEGNNTIAAGECQHVFGKYNISDSSNVEIVGWGTSSTRKNIRTLSSTGNMTIAGTLTQSSDARLKDVQGEVPDLSGVRAVRFKWNDAKGEHDDRDHLGYLAQEVEAVAPFLVGEDSNGYKSLDYIALLCAKVEWLERRVAELEGR